MSAGKIAFITCVSDPARYLRSLRTWRALQVPHGCEVEYIPVADAESLASGYNRAMGATDARYKVYVHQDVSIVYASFLERLVGLFGRYDRLGMLGVVGAKDVPASGVWWNSPRKYGMVFGDPTGAMALLKYADVAGEYERVRAIDGLLMATQYDVRWREDLFKGWHYYDLSQCAEFEKAGFEVGVPRQETPWCVHECGISTMTGFEENRRIFVDYYRDWIPSREEKW